VTNSVDIQVADAIVAALRAATFDIEVPTIERTYADVNRELESLEEIRIDVIPWDCQVEQDSRGTHEYVIETDIVIRQRFGQQSQDADSGLIAKEKVDALGKLRQDVYELFAPAQSTHSGSLDDTDAMFTDVELAEVMHKDMWQKYRQFTAVIRTTHVWNKSPG